MDSSPGSPFDGHMEGCFLAISDDTFSDHDFIWNSGTVLNPNTNSGSISETSRWPFDFTYGAVTGTDTYIDDAVGARSLDTINGSPIYGASLFDVEDAGSQTGAFSSAEATGVRVVKFIFARPSGTYNWNLPFTEDSTKRPTIAVTRSTPSGGTVISNLTIKAIKSASVNGTNLEVYAYTSGPIRYGETFTVTTVSGWYSDSDTDVTGATTNTSGTNSVSSSYGYSKAIARWAIVPYQVYTSSFDLEALAFHIDKIANIKFKQSTTVLGTISNWSQSSLDRLPVYKQSVNPSDYADGAVSFDFEATPNIGDAASIRATATDAPSGAGALAEGPITLYMNSGGSITSAIRYVAATGGNDGNDGLTPESAFATISKGVQSIKASGATIGTIKCAEGTYVYSGDEGTATDNGPWWTITSQSGVARDVLIQPLSYRLGIRRLCYKDVSIYFAGNTGNCLSDNSVFTGDTEIWLNGVYLYSQGELWVLNGQKWYATTEIDRMWVQNTDLYGVTTEGFTACRFVRNCTLDGSQEDVAKGTVMIWGLECKDASEYAGSGQHPDVIQPTSAADLGDVNQIFGFIKALNCDGQQWGCGNGPENYALVNSLFMQKDGDQYLSQLGEPDETCTTRHVLIINVGFVNSDCWLRQFDATTVFFDVAFINSYAQDFGTISSSLDDYDITYENIHEWQGSTLNTRFSSNYGTWTTGNMQFIRGATGNYDSDSVYYGLISTSQLIRPTSVYCPYDLSLKYTPNGGYVGPYYVFKRVVVCDSNTVRMG